MPHCAHEIATNPIDRFVSFYVKNNKMWITGQAPWRRCSRQVGSPKASVYNRRGRKARAYYCPVDNYTVWKEEWAYCCAGAWSRWQTISDCPSCGGGVRRQVRICGIPGVPFDVVCPFRALNRDFICLGNYFNKTKPIIVDLRHKALRFSFCSAPE